MRATILTLAAAVCLFAGERVLRQRRAVPGEVPRRRSIRQGRVGAARSFNHATSTAAENTMNIIAYYRVSTRKQDRSGLGREAQQAAVQGYAKGAMPTC